jgi:uncharacterized protein (DUF488 family)
MRRKAIPLATIGYEGASLGAFLDTLGEAGVTHVLDVRERASSRRKGFSKTALSQALMNEGIDYRHERALGTPQEMRNRYRSHGDIRRYFGEYRKYLATRKPLLDQVAGSLTGHVALLCFERNPDECHRSIVAAELAKRLGTRISHLAVPAPSAAVMGHRQI